MCQSAYNGSDINDSILDNIFNISNYVAYCNNYQANIFYICNDRTKSLDPTLTVQEIENMRIKDSSYYNNKLFDENLYQKAQYINYRKIQTYYSYAGTTDIGQIEQNYNNFLTTRYNYILCYSADKNGISNRKYV